jgi:hypothetical protein
MMIERHGRRFVAGAVWVAAFAALTGACAVSAAVARVPAKDHFAGKVVGTHGRLAGYRGSAIIDLDPQRGTTTRRLTITITGRSCGGVKRCLRLAGTLTGTITNQKAPPDRGQPFLIRAGGGVAPLGTVSASGTGQGTGFVRNGRESLRLTLAGRGGSVSVSVQSDRVPALTSP